MGSGSSSQSKSEILTELVTNTLVQNILKCQRQTILQQQVDIIGNNNVISGVRMNQAYKLDATCFQDTQALADVRNDIAQTIQQAAESQSAGVLSVLGSSNSEVKSTIENRVKNDLTFENIQTAITQINAKQGISVVGDNNIVKNIDMSQFISIVEDNAQTVVNNMSIINDLKSSLDQEASATSKPLPTSLSELITGKTSSGSAGEGLDFNLIIIVLAILAAVVFVLTRKKSHPGGYPPQMRMPYNLRPY